jgi:hypothetical protein
MSESRKIDKEGRELCERCLHWRKGPCSRANCDVRHEVTAAPPPDEDVQFIAPGCSVTRRHPGAE